MTTTAGPEQGSTSTPAPPAAPDGRRRRWPVRLAIVAGGVVGVAGLALGATFLVWSPVNLRGDGAALVGVNMPPGATVTAARAIGPDGAVVPLEVRGDGLWPRRPLASGERVRVDVTVRRPAAVGWLLGDTAHLTTTLRTPTARVTRRWVNLAPGAPLRIAFDQPVRTVLVVDGGAPERHALPLEERSLTLPRPAPAGTIAVAAAARLWERAAPATLVSWFPAGSRPLAIVHPASGHTLAPRDRIRLTLSRPVAATVGAARPTLTPSVPGRWSTPDEHTLLFTPRGLGFPLGATVRLTLPPQLDLAGSHGRQVTLQVPGGSELRVQEILAQLGYLPLRFHPGRPVARTPEAELAAAVAAPAGRFTWRYASTPASLRALWKPGEDGVMTRGALMAFERDQGLTTDGLAGPAVWQALVRAAVANHFQTFGYTYAMVQRALPQSLTIWHNGKIVARTPANTGVPAAPTDPGTYPVFLHLASATMSGTNPDGSHYSDPGVPWISYFNGGDALHGFPRGSYGVPQSVGCVELPIGAAAKVWPYTPVGTLVNVAA